MMSDDKFDIYCANGGAKGQYDFDSEIVNHKKIISNLEKLKSMRQLVIQDMKKNEDDFFPKINSFISDWEGQYPNLRKMFSPTEIDWLLIRSKVHEDVISFVIKSGYKDEPELDEDGKPLLNRATPLMDAISFKSYSYSRVHQLFEVYASFDVNYIDEYGYSHFHAACQYGFDDIVQEFLNHGQNPNILEPKLIYEEEEDEVKNEPITPPLHVALDYKHRKVVELLLKNGADPNLTTTANGFTPLHVIIGGGYLDDDGLADFFFKICDDENLTVEVNIKDRLGDTPFHVALRDKYSYFTELLLRRGADPNLANKEGSTPLHTICKKNDDEKAEIFFKVIDEIQRTVSIDAQDNKGRTPLHFALSNEDEDMIKLLLKRGADPNLANAEGTTPLHTICKNNDDEKAEIFFKVIDEIQRSVSIDAQDNKGRTPLHLALSNEDEDMIKLLLKRGADPNLANEKGSTPLHMISMRLEDDGLMELFFEIIDEVQKTVKVDAVDKSGHTPLQWAVSNFLLDAIDVLLDHGAKLSSFTFPTVGYFDEALKLKYKWTASKLKFVHGTMAVVELLKQRGYELDLSVAIKIMNTFDKHEFLKRPVGLDERWYDNEDFANKAKEMMVKPNLSIYDMMLLRPEASEKLITFAELYDFVDSEEYYELSKIYCDACGAYFCEIRTRQFFKMWALICFANLMNRKLSVFCSFIIIGYLKNEDLRRICLAAAT